jgi:hypothetical protein
MYQGSWTAPSAIGNFESSFEWLSLAAGSNMQRAVPEEF